MCDKCYNDFPSILYRYKFKMHTHINKCNCKWVWCQSRSCNCHISRTFYRYVFRNENFQTRTRYLKGHTPKIPIFSNTFSSVTRLVLTTSGENISLLTKWPINITVCLSSYVCTFSLSIVRRWAGLFRVGLGQKPLFQDALLYTAI